VLRVSGVHEPCWTNHIPYRTTRVYYKVVGDQLRTSILVPSKRLRDFTRRVNNYYKVLRITSVQDVGGGREMITLTKNIRRESIIRIIEELGGIFRHNVANSGMETWEFAITSSAKEEVLERLSKVMSISEVKVWPLKLSEQPRFTESEMKVLRGALQYGYFDYPRKVNSEKVSALLGIDRSTFIYHIRSIERKLASYAKDSSDLQDCGGNSVC